jgi:hypothetical protein
MGRELDIDTPAHRFIYTALKLDAALNRLLDEIA